MNLQEFYLAIDGNMTDVMSRLLTEERVKKFVLRFKDSTTYTELADAYAKGDNDVIFAASHTLKGICLNLAFSKLAKSSSELCEQYRGHAPEIDTAPLFAEVTADYNELMAAINELA